MRSSYKYQFIQSRLLASSSAVLNNSHRRMVRYPRPRRSSVRFIKVIKPDLRSPFTNHFVTRRCCGTNRAQRKAEDRGTSDEAAALLRGLHAERQESVYLQQHTNQKPAGCQHFRQGCRTIFCSKLSVKRLAKSHPQAQGGHQQADEPCRRFPRGMVIRPWDGCDRTV